LVVALGIMGKEPSLLQWVGASVLVCLARIVI